MSLSDHSPRYKQLLRKLKQARLESSLSQQQVADLLRKPQNFVSRVETGQRRIDPIELQEFARIYKKPASYFLD